MATESRAIVDSRGELVRKLKDVKVLCKHCSGHGGFSGTIDDEVI